MVDVYDWLMREDRKHTVDFLGKSAVDHVLDDRDGGEKLMLK
jgi:hypothetical protein